MMITSFGVDLIYVTDTYSVGFFAYLIKKLFGKKYLVRFAGDGAWETAVLNGWTKDYIVDFQRNRHDRTVERLKLKRQKIMISADGVIAVSRFMKMVAENIGVKSSRVRVIYNSVDFMAPNEDHYRRAELIRKKIGQKTKIIVTACRLTPWKGVDGVIKIMPALAEKIKNIKLLVLGDGPEWENLQRLVSELKVGDRVEFLGRVDHNQIIDYFLAADLFILNTHYEGLSHTLLEAMVLGAPILTTDVGGNPETVIHNQTGVLFHYQDQKEMLAGAIKILNDDDFACSLTTQAKEAVKAFDWSKTLNDTSAFINDLGHE